MNVATCRVPPIPYPWRLDELFTAPEMRAADYPGLADCSPVRSLFFDSVAHRDKPTRVFALLGLPEQPLATPCPAMVLVHGGGGSAFVDWVRLWNSRGYAAIAMDTCGCVPVGEYGNWQRHGAGGPAGWGGFEQIDEPIEDHWPYHAVASVVLAHSLLRSLPEVDSDRIGITGISWGGYLTCHAIGVDPRLRFAVPVYGCGHLDNESVWIPDFTAMGKERAQRWLDLWDPKRSLAASSAPIHWVNGTNDFAYPLCAWQQSYRTAPGPRTISAIVRMEHAHHGPGENPEEIHATANYRSGLGPALPRITGQGTEAADAWVTWSYAGAIADVKFNYTRDGGPWSQRHWESVDIPQQGECRAEYRIPADSTAYYFNLIDDRGLTISSEHADTHLGAK